eukprot:CAMPEP_0114671676 /NCGR_PEP_ID=MMETSP0191-20121206/41534_1 /TAXON_ID=126664 /ORGANISM="Sorites sp." /LENGTH=379 /DNA_ID=CAMNT_0001932033 /DNA_START=45 /DNA_END=1184 /DNA_ORIENTATION=-
MAAAGLALGLAQFVIADICPDDADSDLCYDSVNSDQWSSGQRMAPNLNLLFVLLALALPRSSLKQAALSFAALFSLSGAAAATCGDLKTFYKSQQCCGSASKTLTAQWSGCPYNFIPPACSMAEPQTPRDLSTGATGSMTPKAATLNDAQAEFLPLVNVHFHYGAEHKSDSYNNGTLSAAYDAASSGRRLASNPRPGWMCPSDTLTSAQTTPYTFQYCHGVEVGKSYEVHYVHSSAGMDADATDGVNADDLADGLGGAANNRGLLNPMVVVQGQVYQIVAGGPSVDDLLHGWTVVGHQNSVMYPGSTTGQSWDNSVCSPYAITWHVDLECHQVSPESFDNLCKMMKETYSMDSDLHPHGSRILVDSQYVVHQDFVKPLA